MSSSTALSQRRTYIAALTDRTGSMHKIRHDTEGAFDAFIAEQRELTRDLQDQVRVTLIQFDTPPPSTYLGAERPEIEIIYQDLPIEDVPPLVLEPRGWTPLSDAIAYTIRSTETVLNAMAIAQRPNNIVVVIMTDGEENRSIEFPGEDGVRQIAKMVREKQDQGWKFIFIGAGIDAFKVAGNYGVARYDTIPVAASGAGVTMGYSAASQSVTRTRTSGAGGSAPPWEKFGSKPWEKKKDE